MHGNQTQYPRLNAADKSFALDAAEKFYPYFIQKYDGSLLQEGGFKNFEDAEQFINAEVGVVARIIKFDDDEECGFSQAWEWITPSNIKNAPRHIKIEGASIVDSNDAGDGAYDLLGVQGSPEEVGVHILKALQEADLSAGVQSLLDTGETLTLNMHVQIRKQISRKPTINLKKAITDIRVGDRTILPQPNDYIIGGHDHYWILQGGGWTAGEKGFAGDEFVDFEEALENVLADRKSRGDTTSEVWFTAEENVYQLIFSVDNPDIAANAVQYIRREAYAKKHKAFAADAEFFGYRLDSYV